MLFILMGPSSTGKSSIATELNKELKGEIYTGKDYLRFAKNKNYAWNKFKSELVKISKEDISSSIIYVTTEKEDILKLRDIKNAKFIKILSDLETLKSRFSKRMGGNLPKSVEEMLKRQLKEWEEVESDLCINTSVKKDKKIIIKEILENI